MYRLYHMNEFLIFKRVFEVKNGQRLEYHGNIQVPLLVNSLELFGISIFDLFPSGRQEHRLLFLAEF